MIGIVVYLLCGFLVCTVAARKDLLWRDIDVGEAFFITLLLWPMLTMCTVGAWAANAAERYAERYVKWIRESFEKHEEDA